MSARSKSFIIKTVNQCNLSCVYCYAPKYNRDNTEVFPIEYVEKIIQGAIELNIQNVQFVWHGNEPTLAGIPYFEQVIQLQKDLFQSWQCYSNVMQTNGVLLNSRWLKFLKKNDFGVGISIDGPKFINDENRKTTNGMSTHSIAQSAYKNLKHYGCDGGICAVVSKFSLDYPEEIINYFAMLKATEVDLLPCYYAEINQKSLQTSVSANEFADFMLRAFNHWFESDNPDLQIRTFDTIITLLLGGESRFCQYRFDKCNDFMGININGDVYPCDLFVPDERWKIGSLANQSLLEITLSAKNRDYFRRMISHQAECKSCQWFKLCWGGCSHHRYLADKEIHGKSLFCETRKVLFGNIAHSINNYPTIKEKRPLYSTAKNWAEQSKEFPPLYIDVGNACNSHCYFCAADSNTKFREISNRFDKALKAAKKLNLHTMVVSGGEATVLQDLPLFIEKSRRSGLQKILLQTNGRLLHNPTLLLRILRAGVDEFGISLHGHNRGIHDAIIQKPGGFDQTLKFLENLNLLLGSNDLPVTANTVITPDNIAFLSEIAELLIDYNVTGLKFSYLHGIGRAKDLLHKGKWPSMSEIANQLIKAIDFIEIHGKKNTTLAIEGIPFCLLPGNEIYSSSLIIEYVYLASENSDKLTKYHSGMDCAKGSQCKNCSFDSLCFGPWKEYLEIFGGDEIKPITNITPQDVGIVPKNMVV